MLARRGRDYDVLSTTSSQAYGGLEREHPATNRAVDATSGQVLLSDRQLALTLYHANSGGVVEAAEDVWGVQLPHLQRLLDIPSLQGRHARWTCTVDIFEAMKRLAGYGVQCPGLENIEILKRSGSGRVEQVALLGRGEPVFLSGNTLRLILGPAVIKSTRFVVEKVSGLFRFAGTGYGHGVGMSQWGAYAMAQQGATYRDILKYYYPETELLSME
jgi:stage II sporulation protein D